MGKGHYLPICLVCTQDYFLHTGVVLLAEGYLKLLQKLDSDVDKMIAEGACLLPAYCNS